MTTTDPRARLNEIKARADAATEGPWSVHRSERTGTYVTHPDLLGIAREWSLVWQDGDAEFIAHARTDLPAMAAALTAVLDLHPSIGGYWLECDVCADDRGPKPYPCPTVRAITDALGGDQG